MGSIPSKSGPDMEGWTTFYLSKTSEKGLYPTQGEKNALARTRSARPGPAPLPPARACSCAQLEPLRSRFALHTFQVHAGAF